MTEQNQTKIEAYDLEDVYDEQISPLMTQIIEICKKHDMPMLCTFQYAHNDEQGDAQCTTAVAPPERASDRLMQAIYAVSPKQPFAVAMTETTAEDGSKKINIQRIS